MTPTARTRTAALAAVLLIGLTACGSAEDSASTPSSSPSGESAASSPAAAPAEGSDTPAESADDAQAPAGTRESPLPVGTPVEGEDWTVTVTSVSPDATDAVMAANEFNEPPAEGTQYLLAEVSVEYSGEGSEMVMMGTDVAFVTATGETLRTSDTFVVGPDPLDVSQELYAGGTAAGGLVIQVPEGADGLLRVSTGTFGGEEAFVALD